LSTNEPLDVVIIGAGPGGYVAAIRAAQLGLRVALVEREQVGGLCLNWGCIPTKTLLRSAELLWLLRHQAPAYGVRAQGLEFDWAQAQARKAEVVRYLRGGLEVLLYKNQVAVHQGRGRLAGPGRVAVTTGGEDEAPSHPDSPSRPPFREVRRDGASEEILLAKNVIIATGSLPKSLPGVTIDEERVLSSTGALALPAVPRSLAIIGAGAVGVEFASLYRTLGAEVTLIEMLPHILPLEDGDIAAVLAASLIAQGVRIRAGAKVEQVAVSADGVTIALATAGSQAETIAAERVLVAVGRRPRTEGLGLEALGVQMAGGFIVVNETMQTSVPGVYAIGDCVPTLQLAHVASAEGVLAVEHIAGREVVPLNYDQMPRCTYSRPEVASIGLSEEEAMRRGYQVKVGRFPFKNIARSAVLGESEGLVKIVCDVRYDEILGVHLVGPQATELIAEAAALLRREATTEELVRIVHAHPTLAEALQEAGHAVRGQAIYL
jgi:dihydrolipoamide dehydrogenase